jgi:glycosyltransferase involved in cell wall biosynthesis
LNNISTTLRDAKWLPANNIQRAFVRHKNQKGSPGKIWKYSADNLPIKISVIIPTIDAYRDGKFQKLISQLNNQSYKFFEVIVVKGDSRQGRAINVGAAIARGKYLITLDDDTSLPAPETFKNLVEVLEANPDIGIAGGNNVIPQNASYFVKKVMLEVPRRSWEPVKRIIDSDLAEHPLMIIRKDIFYKVGGENEIIIRGLDPYLRLKFREAGYRVVVIPDTNYSHLPPDNLIKMVKQFYRNGKHAAYCNKLYPQWVIETPAEHVKEFKEKRSFLYRIQRFIINFIKKIFKRHFIYLSASTAYAIGFIWGYVSQTEN